MWITACTIGQYSVSGDPGKQEEGNTSIMKRVLMLVGLALVGCGSDCMVPLGTSEQAVWVAGGYGARQDGLRCDALNSGEWCSAPRNTTPIRFKFYASTCSPWWQTRVVEVWNELAPKLANAGWDIQGPTSGGSFNYAIKCGPIATGAYGQFAPEVKGNMDCDDFYNGEFCRHDKGTVWFNTAKIETGPFTAQSETNKQRWGRNEIRHEMGHVFGLGHVLETNTLMNESLPWQFRTSDLDFTAEEWWMIDCYNASDSGISPKC